MPITKTIYTLTEAQAIAATDPNAKVAVDVRVVLTWDNPIEFDLSEVLGHLAKGESFESAIEEVFFDGEYLHEIRDELYEEPEFVVTAETCLIHDDEYDLRPGAAGNAGWLYNQGYREPEE